MKNIHDETKRSFLRKLAGGAALVAAGVAARPGRVAARTENSRACGDEITYRETRAFRDYYRSLRG